jgi:hypothetical protein
VERAVPADVLRLPFADSNFDMVLCLDVLGTWRAVAGS